MFIDLIHITPLFREGEETLAVKYTHPETGVTLEIPYDDLVNTVVAIDAMLSGPADAEEFELVEQEQIPGVLATHEDAIEEQVLSGAPSGLRVMRTHIPLDDM